MKRLLILSVSVLLLSACTRPEHSVGVLDEAGYTKINITGYHFFGCGRDDRFRTGFEATSPKGKRVSGVVCSKLCLVCNGQSADTIRID